MKQQKEKTKQLSQNEKFPNNRIEVEVEEEGKKQLRVAII